MLNKNESNRDHESLHQNRFFSDLAVDKHDNFQFSKAEFFVFMLPSKNSPGFGGYLYLFFQEEIK